MTDTPSVANVLAVYNSATADNLRNGLSWYSDAHNFCRRAGGRRDYHIARNAGIVAALSPLNGWNNNKRAASLLISRRGDGTGLGLYRNVAKAARIYRGESPLDVLSGNKVRAFYSTILSPNDPDAIPVIDRHAFDIAVGERTDDKRRATLSRKGMYEIFSEVYREAAHIAGIGAPQMQAVTWVEWRSRYSTYDA